MSGTTGTPSDGEPTLEWAYVLHRGSYSDRRPVAVFTGDTEAAMLERAARAASG